MITKGLLFFSFFSSWASFSRKTKNSRRCCFRAEVECWDWYRLIWKVSQFLLFIYLFVDAHHNLSQSASSFCCIMAEFRKKDHWKKIRTRYFWLWFCLHKTWKLFFSRFWGARFYVLLNTCIIIKTSAKVHRNPFLIISLPS